METILSELNLNGIPAIRVLNKMDLVDSEIRQHHVRRLKGIAVSALTRSTLKPLTEEMEASVEHLLENNR